MKENNNVFIPKDSNDLFLEMKKYNLQGNLLKNKDMIIWKLENQIIIKIYVNDLPNEGYIDIYYLKDGKEMSLTHWHPYEDELFNDLMDIHFGRIIWVKKKTLFGETLPIIIERKVYENMNDKKKRKYTVVEK